MFIAGLFLFAAASDAAGSAATPPPTVVSPLTIYAQPKTAPPADATVQIDSNGEGPGRQRVTVFPTYSWVRGVGGEVTLTCLIDVHGLAEKCRVAFEQPQGHGFGAAALEQQPLLRITPKTGPDGRPVAAEMNIALQFKPPVKEDNVSDIEKTCRGCSEIDGSKLNVIHAPLNMRHVVMMNHPAWTQTPTFEDLAAAYPAGARGAEGYVVLHCEVRRGSGALRACITARQDPAAGAFGAAAQGLATKFRVSPEALSHAPHDGAIEVDIPIRFTPPAELSERRVTAPNWLVLVDPGQVPKVFPPEAAVKGLVTGRGVARCRVGADGGLTACEPGPAEPESLGFSEAAVKLASNLRMNLWSADAQPVQGGRIDLPFRIELAPAQ